ncbi:hypothetical protein [Reinekea marinisedimentorum]|uniref:Uncharacterized protein n=1 Tax=Reinekea marinisedimentorum TaxID=230495 RepID=A0A4R3ID10_9GAMM|nr:hypothetical protein [Reinekea marinisedimentorum]TCS42525.1 hypothetical protein BCF53_103186 [Reinekea marinisedimentorum]
MNVLVKQNSRGRINNPFTEMQKYRIETMSHLWEGYFRYQVGKYFVFSIDVQGYQEFMFRYDELEYAFIHELDSETGAFIPMFLLDKTNRIRNL